MLTVPELPPSDWEVGIVICKQKLANPIRRSSFKQVHLQYNVLAIAVGAVALVGTGAGLNFLPLAEALKTAAVTAAAV